MKTMHPGSIRYPLIYQSFKTAREVADVINRGTTYVHKALKQGFTDREKQMLEAYAGRKLFEDV